MSGALFLCFSVVVEQRGPLLRNQENLFLIHKPQKPVHKTELRRPTSQGHYANTSKSWDNEGRVGSQKMWVPIPFVVVIICVKSYGRVCSLPTSTLHGSSANEHLVRRKRETQINGFQVAGNHPLSGVLFIFEFGVDRDGMERKTLHVSRVNTVS